MTAKAYHHGDLKHALIEAGIELINREGEDHFSLRSTAAACGVSNAAPYAHFQNKEELLLAMKEHVTQEFTSVLQNTVAAYPMDLYMITRLGKAYVLFFIQNPHYYSFLFSRANITVSLSPDTEEGENYPPFALFQATARQLLAPSGLTDTQMNHQIIAMWALVHGLAGIAVMEHVRFSGSWEDQIEAIITSMPVNGKLARGQEAVK